MLHSGERFLDCSATWASPLPRAELEGCARARRYILGNIEHTRGVRKGDRLWQLGFGGGFKCNSAVWRALRDIRQPHAAWAERPRQG